MRRLVLGALMSYCGACAASAGDLIEFEDKAVWEAAVGEFTTIGFTGFPEFTIITDQYSELGILFTDGNDSVGLGETIFPNDGAGLLGTHITSIDVAFDVPQRWIAVDFPGVARIDLYRDGELIAQSTWFDAPPISGVGGFGGVISSEPFDAAVILDPEDQVVSIDDLHFGGAIPAPGAVVVLVSIGLVRRRRR
jgi:hypothetical protein